MAEPTELMLEHLRAIRGDIAGMKDDMRAMRAEMTAMRQHLAGVITFQEHDHGDMPRSRFVSIALRDGWTSWIESW